MSRIVITFISIFIYLISTTNTLAAGGCDTLKTYVYNASDKTTLKVKIGQDSSKTQLQEAYINPKELAFIATSEYNSYSEGPTYSYVEIWENNLIGSKQTFHRWIQT